MTPLTPSDYIILEDYKGSPVALILAILIGIVVTIAGGTWLFFHFLNWIMK